jgi:hypothetical protein
MSNLPERPVPPVLPTPEQVPTELRGLKRWVGWRAQWDDSLHKWRKPPHSPLTGEAIGPSDKWAEHWLTFDEALSGAVKHHLDGVGFIFKDGDGYVGIDFDDCRKDGVIHSETVNWLRWFPTFQELSPSGSGIHALCKGIIRKALKATQLPNGDGTSVEMYSQGRYFTFTGQSIGSKLDLGDCQIGIEKLIVHLGERNVAEQVDIEHPMLKFTARKLHQDNLAVFRAMKRPEDPQNDTLNSVAFFAARAFAAEVFEGTEQQLQEEIRQIALSTPYCPGVEDTLRSGWQNGIGKPLKIMEERWPQVIETLEEFNRDFYVVRNFGGKSRVCWEQQNTSYRGKALLLGHSNPRDFESFHRNQLIQVGEKEGKNEAGEPMMVPVLKNKASVWLDHRYRRQYREVQFVPNADLGEDVRNLWHGFAYEPKKGDCSLYLAHINDNICRNDPEKYNYLIRWMAYAIRHPDEQGHAAIVVQGLKGVGKNIWANGFGELWGEHALTVSDSTRITNNFNAHLRALCVLIADEAFFAGDRRHEGKLKSLVTSSTLDIEAKGVDVVQVPNLLHIIILGNDRWLVPASSDERRFLVLNCSDAHRNDQKYFGAILRQLEKGGYEALMHHLLEEVDLRDFNVRNVPHTKELRAQIIESLRDADKAWFECLCTGIIPGRLQKDKSVLVRTIDMVDWANGRRSNGWGHIRPQYIDAMFGDDDKGMNFQRDVSLNRSNKLRYWVVPGLDKCRSVWDRLRGVYEWPDDGGEWDTLSDEIRF